MKHFFLALFTLLLSLKSFSQLSCEVGLSAGLMNAGTDVGAKKGSNLNPLYYDWNLTQLNVGVYGQVTYKNLVGARLEFTNGVVAANDVNSNSKHINTRNLNFKSHIYEASLLTTFYPTSLLKLKKPLKVTPYFMAGVGVFSFFPKAWCNGEWVRLRQLHTEGQNSMQYPDRKEYSLTAMSIPVGMGTTYQLSPTINARIEVIYRYTNTDYLDDVSKTYVDPQIIKDCVPNNQEAHAVMMATSYTDKANKNFTGKARGDASNNDRFFTFNFKIGYIIGKN